MNPSEYQNLNIQLSNISGIERFRSASINLEYMAMMFVNSEIEYDQTKYKYLIDQSFNPEGTKAKVITSSERFSNQLIDRVIKGQSNNLTLDNESTEGDRVLSNFASADEKAASGYITDMPNNSKV